jgi:hypothetical protein
MKTLIPLTALAALVATGSIHAQTPAFSKPSGYVTQTIAQGFNPIGFTLQLPPTTNGTFTAVGTTTVSDSTKNFSTILTAGALYILEIGSGTASNQVVEVGSGSGSNLNTTGNLQVAGAVVGDSYVLRKATTLEEIFGTTNSVLTKSNSVNTADVVWVPDGSGGYTRYFQNAAGAWRNATTPGLAPNTPIVYLDAVFIQRKNAQSVDLTLTGQVKTTPSKSAIVQGFNFISTIYPAGATLQNSGLSSTLAKSNSVNSADVVWVPNGSGSYIRYFVNASGVWRNATTPGVAADPTPITTAIFVQRKVGSTTVNLTPPSSYSGL